MCFAVPVLIGPWNFWGFAICGPQNFGYVDTSIFIAFDINSSFLSALIMLDVSRALIKGPAKLW